MKAENGDEDVVGTPFPSEDVEPAEDPVDA